MGVAFSHTGTYGEKNAGRRTRRGSARWYWQTWGWPLLVASGVDFFCDFRAKLDLQTLVLDISGSIWSGAGCRNCLFNSLFSLQFFNPVICCVDLYMLFHFGQPPLALAKRTLDPQWFRVPPGSHQWRASLPQAQFSNATRFQHSHGRSVQRKAVWRASGGEWGDSQCSLDPWRPW